MLSVIALVVLRLTIGWHFLYEGVWKVENADKFSAMPFLTLAKGPFAQMFYAMSPDLNGELRLKPALDEEKAIKLDEEEAKKPLVPEPPKSDGTEKKEKLTNHETLLTHVKWWVVKDFKSDVKKVSEEVKVPYVETTWNLEEKTANVLIYPAYFNPTKEIFEFVAGEKGMVTPPKPTKEDIKKAAEEKVKADAEKKAADAEKKADNAEKKDAAKTDAEAEKKPAEEATTYGPYALTEDQMKSLKAAWGRYVTDMNDLHKADGMAALTFLESHQLLMDKKSGPNNGP